MTRAMSMTKTMEHDKVHGPTITTPCVGDIDLTRGKISPRHSVRCAFRDGLSQPIPRTQANPQPRHDLYRKMQKLARYQDCAADSPSSRRTVIASHDAFGYFGDAYGLRCIAYVGVSGEADPSARDVARVTDFARKQGAAGIFVENVTNPKLVRQIARETGAVVGGTLYSDALAPEGQPAGTYLGMFSWNAGRLIRVLKPDHK